MITSNSNPKVKKLLTWQKKRKVREEDGIYIVEGLRMFVEAPQDKADKAARILAEEMQGAVKLSVPLTADAKEGKSWYDAH